MLEGLAKTRFVALSNRRRNVYARSTAKRFNFYDVGF